jgi:DNA-binding transcriptional regulator YiaG
MNKITIESGELKAYRLSHCLTQTQFARLLHIPYRTYERYEQGRSVIPYAYWELLHLKLDK